MHGNEAANSATRGSRNGARSSSPSEGSAAWHQLNQKALIEQAFAERRTVTQTSVERRFAKLEAWAGKLAQKRANFKTQIQIEAFNEEAAKLPENVVVLTVSLDLPFAQKRWCAAAGVDRVKVVSDVVDAEFGLKYGVLIKERRYLRRAVFIVGRDGKLTYVNYLPTLGQEPDYDEVINAAKESLK